MAEQINFRKEILSSILPYARKDEKINLLVCDMGFGAIDSFRSEFPSRVINMGIMEQSTVGIAAGMAMAGLKPIVYSIVNFLIYRAAEQIRNDIFLQDLNVKLIGNGVNDYFKFLGKSHCSGQDDIKIMELLGVKVYDPYNTKSNYYELVEEWINSDKPGYFRV